MDSIIETQRSLHEERERCLDLAVKEFLAEKKNQRERVNSEHRTRDTIERYNKATSQLIEIYSDLTGERAREIQQLGGPNEFAEFYQRLKLMKSFYAKNPNEEATSLTLEFEKKLTFIANPDRVEKETVTFTDEEGYGKFLDMHLLFDQYINLKDIKARSFFPFIQLKIDYIKYLETFDRLYEIPRETTKKTGAYKEYATTLLNYLVDFIGRAKPLINIEGVTLKADEEFESKWREEKMPGWAKDKPASATANGPIAAVDVSEYETVEQLEALGADRLKAALIAAGLKCGGTVKERAARLFATKTMTEEQLAKLKKPSVSAEALKEERRAYTLAKLEHQIYKFVELVGEERQATRENVERKQARGFGEEEEEEDMAEDIEEEVLDDDIPYNPKNLPLGWDGKPIPYWLYKLHGLNINYVCEICGNQVYKGPKAFQRHFSEWRHTHSLTCLGIKNTAHFTNITKIQDALDLWTKLCSEINQTKWNPEMDEQFEDSKGNVLNRRTFEDLKRQGLL
ncbi:Splicing factor 3A subunit 3 family protein [Aphelenchoides fujianensis]|nr:Splicing factor 3A subunit 3 family protein [Aphelenchoides fujianensis]